LEMSGKGDTSTTPLLLAIARICQSFFKSKTVLLLLCHAFLQSHGAIG
jgi:hypothetical protein